MNGNKKSELEADDFWSLESLLPPSEKRRAGIASNDVSLTDFEIDGAESGISGERIPKREESYPPVTSANKVSFESWLDGRREQEKNRHAYGKRTVLEYAPEGRFIKKVTVSEEIGQRSGGERFISDGQRSLGLEGDFCGNVPFDSFYPQYSQLSREQLKCYIGFRTEVKKGHFPEVSRSYIYLYLYELINFSVPSPKERAETVASLINGYPGCDERLFSDMCNWLVDICLINRLEIPKSIYGGAFNRVLECAKIKEVFLDGRDGRADPFLALMLTASGYDYKRSKFYPEFSEYYDRYIPPSVTQELKRLSEIDVRYSDTSAQSCNFSHESYFGAFCISAVRRTVTLEMRCVTKDESVKKTVSDMVKYAENRLRAALMIKPRLTVVYLPIQIRERIKSFFDLNAFGISPKKEKKVKAQVYEPAEYEKYYEPTESGISEDAAREIEKESWQITDRLVKGLESSENEYTPMDYSVLPCDPYGKENAPSDKEEKKAETVFDKECKTSESATPLPVLSSSSGADTVALALASLLDGNTEEFKALAKQKGMLVAAFADMINEEIFDEIGDSVIAEGGNGYFIIEDYTDDVRMTVDARLSNG